MASLKRKADSQASNGVSKRTKSDQNSTRPKSGTAEKENAEPGKSSKGKSKIVVSKEQALFPRGGGGVLTPVERKQIHAQAVRDAEREHAQPKDLFAGSVSSSEGDDSGTEAPKPSTESRQRKWNNSRKKPAKEDPKKSTTTKIAGLTYKRLSVGTLVFGQVISIAQKDATVALPNGLLGYIPLTSVSREFSTKLNSLLKIEDNQEETARDQAQVSVLGEDLDEIIALDQALRIGQFLRVAVTSIGQTASAGDRFKRRIELSSDPELVNAGLSQSALANNVMLQAAVSSVEDHGLVMNLGFEDAQLRGFISTKSLPSGTSLSDFKEGSVLLCQIADLNSGGKVIKLTADPSKQRVLKTAPSVDSFLPGTVAELLVTEVQDAGLVGKAMGMLDCTADIVHSGSYQDKEAFHKCYPLGKKVRARLLFNLPASDRPSNGASLLTHLTEPSSSTETLLSEGRRAISSTIPTAAVSRVEPGLGVYLDIGQDRTGFAHTSRLADSKVESLSESTGKFKLGTNHKARILDYNPVDGLYTLTLQDSVLKQRFLRSEDVPTGDIVDGTIDKVLVGANGVSGLVIKIAEGVTGLVPAIHFSDAILQHPETKFREGRTVRARVLSVDAAKKQLRLTLKKTLVNSEAQIWDSFSKISMGDSTVGTLVKVESSGALVQFYGQVKGYLPVAEMSEAYIKDAREHFRLGQVVNVIAISLDVESERLTVSCREALTKTDLTKAPLSSIQPGTLINGVVFEKSNEDVLLRLSDADAIARLAIDHATDGSLKKRQSFLSKIRVGQKLEGLLVLNILPRQRLVLLSNRQSLIQAMEEGQLLSNLEALEEGKRVTGLVSNITSDGVFVSFAGGITGLLPPRNLLAGSDTKEDFGFKKLQVVPCRVSNIDYRGASPRFWLTLKDAPAPVEELTEMNGKVLVDPVDADLLSEYQLVLNKITKARIVSVKESQLNVELAKNLQGRIDVSEVFDNWDDIKDRKKPLRTFTTGQVISVKVLGAHDTRNHRFLPLTHRKGKNTVFELSAKPSTIANPAFGLLSYGDLKLESSWLAYVNNISHDCVWVNITPSVRGRIKAMDVSDDLSLAGNLEQNFPIGSAIRVRVVAVDEIKGRLDLSARTGDITKNLGLDDLAPGLILPGRITKISDRQVIVQLSDNLVGGVDLIDLTDDYNEADPARFGKGEVVRTCVLKVDAANKRVLLSLRPSRVLSSSLKSKDPEITDIKQLQVNDVYRGFVRNVDDKGVFITLGHSITAFVRVAHLSDDFLKDWKDSFQRDQLVQGKVIKIDRSSGHVQMSLKDSVINNDYTPPIAMHDLQVGDVVNGKAAKVEEFGVFIVVDNSENVRGLCHRSEIAEQRVEDARKLFSEGDALKAKVLKIDLEKRRINFGLKASYFDSVAEFDSVDSADDDASGKDISGPFDDELSDRVDLDSDDGDFSGEHDEADDNDDDDGQEDTDGGLDLERVPVDPATREDILPGKDGISLNVGGFDWHGLSSTAARTKRSAASQSQAQNAASEPPKKRKKRADIQVDHTGDLDADGPQSADDFERLLMGEPDSSLLWLQYMAFHLETGDITQAREIAERALKSISLGLEAEKLNVWVALLNLENAYGDDDTVDAVFKRACEYNDSQEMHSRLTSIYIQSDKKEKADQMFQTMLKKFTQDPKIWLNYATFLYDTVQDAEKGRELLPRALQVLPKFTQLELTSKFAQIEFKSASGLPERGRTIFEGLLASFPKRIDLYSVLLDLELKLGDEEQIRRVFERVFNGKLKPKQAKYFFKRWLAFEESKGDERKIDEVKAKAAAWIRSAGGDED